MDTSGSADPARQTFPVAQRDPPCDRPEWEPAKEVTQTSLSAPQVYSEDDITIRIGGNVTFTCTI